MNKPSNTSEQTSLQLPKKPKEPEPYECCEQGCDPCIYDYYAKALARWELKVAELTKLQSELNSNED